MNKTFIVAGSALAIVSSAFAAQADMLGGTEIRQTIGGKRVNLQTSFGIEFPMYYKANGRVTGDGRGTGLGKYFAPKETGRWWVTGNRMCQQFPTWYDGRPLCFQLRKVGPGKLQWIREDGKTGTARVISS